MSDILKLMQERRSARVLFDGERPLARDDLRQILEAARWAPTAHNMQNFEIVVVDDRKLLEEISNLRGEISQAFLKENYEQLSFSEEELQQKGTGLLAAMFPPSWRTPDPRPEPGDGRSAFIGQAIRTSAALLIVTYDPRRRAPASEGDFLGIMSLGCVMQNLWLMAQSLGIGLHLLSSLGAEPMATDVRHLVGIPDALRIAFACRLGHVVSPPTNLRVRRSLEAFAHHNRFGQRGV